MLCSFTCGTQPGRVRARVRAYARVCRRDCVQHVCLYTGAHILRQRSDLVLEVADARGRDVGLARERPQSAPFTHSLCRRRPGRCHTARSWGERRVLHCIPTGLTRARTHRGEHTPTHAHTHTHTHTRTHTHTHTHAHTHTHTHTHTHSTRAHQRRAHQAALRMCVCVCVRHLVKSHT